MPVASNPTPSCVNQKGLNTFLNISQRVKLSLVENHHSKIIDVDPLHTTQATGLKSTKWRWRSLIVGVGGRVRHRMCRENSTIAQWQQLSERASKITLPERAFYKWLGHKNPAHSMACNFLKLSYHRINTKMLEKRDGKGQ